MNSEIIPTGAFSERYLQKTNLSHVHAIPIMDVSGTKSLCIGQSTQSQSISYINSVNFLTERHLFSFPRAQTSDASTVQWVSQSASTESPHGINAKLTKFNDPEKTLGCSSFRRHRLRRVIPTPIGLMEPSVPEQSNTVMNEPRDIRRSTICGTTRSILKKCGIPQGYKITDQSLITTEPSAMVVTPIPRPLNEALIPAAASCRVVSVQPIGSGNTARWSGAVDAVSTRPVRIEDCRSNSTGRPFPPMIKSSATSNVRAVDSIDLNPNINSARSNSVSCEAGNSNSFVAVANVLLKSVAWKRASDKFQLKRAHPKTNRSPSVLVANQVFMSSTEPVAAPSKPSLGRMHSEVVAPLARTISRPKSAIGDGDDDANSGLQTIEKISKLHGYLSAHNIDDLLRRTNYSRRELYVMYGRFKALCSLSGSPLGIDKQTFKTGIARLAVEDDLFVDRVFDLVDQDGSGCIEWNEFLTALSALEKGSPEMKVKFCLQVYDIDGDGFISRGDLSNMFLSSSMLEIDQTTQDVCSAFVDKVFLQVLPDYNQDPQAKIGLEDLHAFMRRRAGVQDLDEDIWDVLGRSMLKDFSQRRGE